MQGRIKMYKADKGYGFIKGEDGNDYFAHESDIKTYDTILRGMKCSFKPDTNDKGRLAKNIEVKKENKKNFIQFGEIRIKASNIKSYGLAKGTHSVYYEQLYKEDKIHPIERAIGVVMAADGLAESFLGSRGSEAFGEGLDMAFSDKKTVKDRLVKIDYLKYCDLSEEKRVCKEEINDYLYVTTYQKDNHTFYENDVSFNIRNKLQEIDNCMS